MQWLRMMVVCGVAGGIALAGSNPMQGWNFRFKGFVIGAWWGPGETDAEMAVYKEAGFNVAMIGRYMAVDAHGLPRYDGRFGKADMLKKQLDLCRRHGVWAMVDTYTPNDRPWGGRMGKIDGHPRHHAASLVELKWLCDRLAPHPALLGFLLGDDKSRLNARMIGCTRYLQAQHPDLMPWICQNRADPRSLAQNGNPIFNLQIYPTLYRRRDSAARNALAYCSAFAAMRRAGRRYGLLMWPMWNASRVTGDSLIRFPIYAALAYGADGYWAFCYGNDCFMKRGRYRTRAEVEAGRTRMYPVVKKANLRVRAWAPHLLGSDCPGLFANTGAADAISPGPGRLVAAMSDAMLVGILTKPGQPPLAMVVDARVSRRFGEPGPRRVQVLFDNAVRAIDIVATPETGRRPTVRGNSVRLNLEAGEGRLLILHGGPGLARMLPRGQ